MQHHHLFVLSVLYSHKYVVFLSQGPPLGHGNEKKYKKMGRYKKYSKLEKSCLVKAEFV